MSNYSAPKDIIAEQVRQLLDLDEGGQRAQLESLSTYVATKNTRKNHSVNGGTSRSKGDRARPGVPSSQSMSTSYDSSNGGNSQEPSNSAESTEGSGSEGVAQGQAVDGIGSPADVSFEKNEPAFLGVSKATHAETSASQQLQELQHSTDLLKAALANWEACLQTEEVHTNIQKISTSQQALATEQTMPAKIQIQPLKPAKPSLTSAASKAATDAKPDVLVNALHKALSDLIVSLPADTVSQGLQQEGQQQQQEWLGTVQEDMDSNAVKWLRQRLEKQQEESLSKIMNMMQSNSTQQVQQPTNFDAGATLLDKKILNLMQNSSTQQVQQPTNFEAGANLLDNVQQLHHLQQTGLVTEPVSQRIQNMMQSDNTQAMQQPMGFHAGGHFLDNMQQIQQHSGFDAGFDCFASPANQGYGEAWPPMAMGMQHTPSFAGAYAGQPMFPPMQMPGASPMPPMFMEPAMSWPYQMQTPGAIDLGTVHLQQPSNSQAPLQEPINSQAGEQCTSAAPAAPPGQTGNIPRKNRTVAPAGVEEESLRTHLRELQNVNSDNVILVRKINRLGFESPAVLKAHYSKYGKVECVLVAHSHVKSQNRRFAARLRPSGLGFVVMTNKADADAILAQGSEQVVGDGKEKVTIRVQRFQRRSEDLQDADLRDDDAGGW